MNDEIIKALIALVFTGIIGGIVKVYFDYKGKLIENIWEKRLEAYTEFVKLTSLFPKYPKSQVKWEEVYKLSTKFRDWYFMGNGLFLSTKIREVYFELQKNILKQTKDKINSIELLEDEKYDFFQEECSKIRSLMAKELESRESPFWHLFTKKSKA